MMPVVATIATVAEPWAMRSASEITNASTISGRPVLVRLLDRTLPMPLATRMLPNTPPAPTSSAISGAPMNPSTC